MQREIRVLGASEHGKEDLFRSLKKQLLESEQPITSNDLDVSVSRIIDKLKALKKEERGDFFERLENFFSREKKVQEKKFYVVDELSDDELALEAQNISKGEIQGAVFSHSVSALQKAKDFDHDLYSEQRQAVDRIKLALMEKLKTAITREKSLNDLHFSDIQLVKSSITSPAKFVNPNLKVQRDLNLKEHVLRTFDGAEIEEQLTPQDNIFFKNGRKKLAELPPNPYLVTVEAATTKQHIVEHLQLTTIKKESVKETASAVHLLKAFRDTVRGGMFLEQNELVLQDISLDNLGIKDEGSTKEHGVLFDLDFIVPEGSAVTVRVHKPEYRFPKEFTDFGRASRKEMIFQFGRALQVLRQNLAKTNPKYSADFLSQLDFISLLATYPLKEKFPKMTDMEERLNNLISKLEKNEIPLFTQP